MPLFDASQACAVPSLDPFLPSWQFTAVSVPFTCTATVVVILRLYARRFVARSYGLDDFLNCTALLCAWTFCGLGITLSFGGRVDSWSSHAPQGATVLKVALCLQIVYFLGSMFLKLSILSFYLRISPNQKFRITIYIIGIFEVCVEVISCAIVLFGCSPVSGAWGIPSTAKCVDKDAYYVVQAGLNAVTYIATVAIPIPMCTKLRIPARQKWLLVTLLTLGSLTCAFSIVRLIALAQTFSGTSRKDIHNAIWCIIEITIGIICASLPATKPLFGNHCLGGPDVTELTSVKQVHPNTPPGSPLSISSATSMKCGDLSASKPFKTCSFHVSTGSPWAEERTPSNPHHINNNKDIWEGRIRSDISEFEVNDEQVRADTGRRWAEKFVKRSFQKLKIRL